MQILKKIVSFLLRISISVALLVFLFSRVDKGSLLSILKNADRSLLFVALFIFSLNYVLSLFRWEMLLRASRINLPMKRVIISFAGGVFFSIFLPSTIGGDLMRSVDLATYTRKPREVVATVLMDRLSGYIGLVILAAISLAVGFGLVRDRSVLISVAVLALVLICVLLVLFDKALYTKVNRIVQSPNAGRMRQILSSLHRELHIFRRHKDIIVDNLVLSILIQITTPLTFFITAKSLGLDVNIAYFMIFIPIISAVTLLPISIGGLGLRDAMTIYFFAKAGVSKDMSFAMSLVNFSFILFFGVLGGLIYVLTVRHRRLQHHKPPAIQPHAKKP